MATLIGNIKAPNGQYKDRETGQDKTRWLQCGVLLERGDGSWVMKLEALPVAPKAREGDNGLWLNVYPPEDSNG